MNFSTIFGIDSHAHTTTVAAIETETGVCESRTFVGNDYGDMRAWMERFPAPGRGVYESGCTGFVPSRELTTESVQVVPIASAKMPTSDDSRKRKNDLNDARRLARLEIAGELKEVYVPSVEVEGLRDLSNALDDLKGQLTVARQRVSGLLCRHNVIWDERTKTGRLKKRWGSDFWRWLRAVRLPDASSQASLEAAIRAVESAKEQYEALESKARKLAMPSCLGTEMAALTCLKGVQFVTALAFCAQVGDFFRFTSGRKVTAYFGFSPSEGSSADRHRLGSITRSGCGKVRKLLTECAWSLTRGKVASRKRRPDGVPGDVYERAVTLSNRLVERRKTLVDGGLAKNKANVASAAELARFMLFLGQMAHERAAESDALAAESDALACVAD